MAARFWVTGGTGNWNDTSNWSATTGGASGASVPGSADTAALDANSGSGTVTLDISPDIQTLTCTGFTGTLAFGTNTISLNSTGTIFTGATTMTVTGTPLIILNNNTASARTVTPGAVTEANSISFRVISGTGSMVFTAGSVRDLDFTDGTNPTGFGGNVTNTAITIYGNFKASTSGMTRTPGTQAYTFAATSGTKTINTSGVTFDNPFTFNGVGGTWQLQDALTSGATRTCTLTNGTLDLNGYTATFSAFSSSNSNTRTLAFGSTGKIVLTGTGTITIFTTSIATNLTVTGSRRVEVTGGGVLGGIRTITGGNVASGGGSAASAMDFFISSGTDEISMGTVARAYRTLDYTGFSGTTNVNSAYQIYGSVVLSPTMAISGSSYSWTFAATDAQTITTNGVSFDVNIIFDGTGGGIWSFTDALTMSLNRTLTMTNGTLRLKDGTTNTIRAFATTGTTLKYLQSTTAGVQATMSDVSGTNSVTYLSIQDSNATGGAYWDATNGTNVNAGNNTGWDFGGSTVDGCGNTFAFGFGFRI